LVVRQAQVFRDKQNINLLTGHCAENIDPGQQTVSGVTLEGDRFKFPYDKLLIATGGAAVRPDLVGIDRPEVMVLKSLEDGREIKKLLKNNRIQKAVIIKVVITQISCRITNKIVIAVFLIWIVNLTAIVNRVRDPIIVIIFITKIPNIVIVIISLLRIISCSAIVKSICYAVTIDIRVTGIPFTIAVCVNLIIIGHLRAIVAGVPVVVPI